MIILGQERLKQEENNRILKEIKELAECTFRPMITPLPSKDVDPSNHHIKGVQRHLELQRLAKQMKSDQIEWEKKIFFSHVSIESRVKAPNNSNLNLLCAEYYCAVSWSLRLFDFLSKTTEGQSSSTQYRSRSISTQAAAALAVLDLLWIDGTEWSHRCPYILTCVLRENLIFFRVSRVPDCVTSVPTNDLRTGTKVGQNLIDTENKWRMYELINKTNTKGLVYVEYSCLLSTL